MPRAVWALEVRVNSEGCAGNTLLQQNVAVDAENFSSMGDGTVHAKEEDVRKITHVLEIRYDRRIRGSASSTL